MNKDEKSVSKVLQLVKISKNEDKKHNSNLSSKLDSNFSGVSKRPLNKSSNLINPIENKIKTPEKIKEDYQNTEPTNLTTINDQIPKKIDTDALIQDEKRRMLLSDI